MAEALQILPLTAEAFAAYGDVIESEGRDSFAINNGMAERYHALADVTIAGADAGAVISLVHSRRFELPRLVDHLEYHPLGSQAFIPLDSGAFIVVVAAAASVPDLDALEAFVTNGEQGINYHAGTWHHVLLTPYAAMRFVCVDRVGTGNNCIDYFFPQAQQRSIA